MRPLAAARFALAALALGLGLAIAPRTARADAAVLLGFTTGARLEAPTPRARFVVGGGPDLLRDDGLALSLRAEVTHVLDGDASLLVGWMGPGLREGTGLPLGLAAGPAIAWTARGEALAGGHVRASVSLWYARAVLELDAGLTAPLGSDREAIFSASLALRWVPWSPWRL